MTKAIILYPLAGLVSLFAVIGLFIILATVVIVGSALVGEAESAYHQFLFANDSAVLSVPTSVIGDSAFGITTDYASTTDALDARMFNFTGKHAQGVWHDRNWSIELERGDFAEVYTGSDGELHVKIHKIGTGEIIDRLLVP